MATVPAATSYFCSRTVQPRQAQPPVPTAPENWRRTGACYWRRTEGRVGSVVRDAVAVRKGLAVSDDRPHPTPTVLLTLHEAATFLRTPVATLRYWRHLGVGPAGFRLGRRVIYRRGDVDRWLSERQDAETR